MQFSTYLYTETISVTNNSGSTLHPPLYLIFVGLPEPSWLPTRKWYVWRLTNHLLYATGRRYATFTSGGFAAGKQNRDSTPLLHAKPFRGPSLHTEGHQWHTVEMMGMVTTMRCHPILKSVVLAYLLLVAVETGRAEQRPLIPSP